MTGEILEEREVIAAAPGRVAWAGPRAGGWGKLVTIAHGHGVRTMYAHLSAVEVKVGEWVAGGTSTSRSASTVERSTRCARSCGSTERGRSRA